MLCPKTVQTRVTAKRPKTIAYPRGVRKLPIQGKHSPPSESIRTSQDYKCCSWKAFKKYVITLQATSAIRLVKKITKSRKVDKKVYEDKMVRREKEVKTTHVEYLFICMDPSRIMAEPYD